MLWSPQQEQALRRARRWLQQPDRRVFRLYGYAGTGKTELARELGYHDVRVHFAAFTGKAAHVLRQRGCEPVSTIHSLIYRPLFDADGNLISYELRTRDELIQRRPDRGRRSVDGQRPAGRRFVELRDPSPVGRRSRAITASHGHRRVHARRTGRHVDGNPQAGGGKSDPPAGRQYPPRRGAAASQGIAPGSRC